MNVLRVITPSPRGVWQDLVDANPSALPSQLPVWTDAICSVGHYTDVSRLYQMADGRELVLPMVRRTGRPASVATEFSMAPTWGTGGLVGRTPPTAPEVAAVLADLASRKVLRTTVRPDFRQAPLWADARPARAVELPITHHVLDLDRPFVELWSRFSKMARKAIRKAEREGVEIVQAAGTTHLRDFYDLYEGWVERRAGERGIPLAIARRRGRANEPFERLVMLADGLGATFRVWIAKLDGEPVAAMITLMRGDVALAWRAASDKEVAGPVRANDLLHRYAIEHACLQGCRYYNMGESGGVESLMRFKTRFGATPRVHAGYCLERVPISVVTRRGDVAVHRAEALVVGLAARRHHDTAPHTETVPSSDTVPISDTAPSRETVSPNGETPAAAGVPDGGRTRT